MKKYFSVFVIFIFFSPQLFSQYRDEYKNYVQKEDYLHEADKFLPIVIKPKSAICLFEKASKLGFISIYDRITWGWLHLRKNEFKQAQIVLLHEDTYSNYCFCDDPMNEFYTLCPIDIYQKSILYKNMLKSDNWDEFERSMRTILVQQQNTDYLELKEIYIRDQIYRRKMSSSTITDKERDSLWTKQSINDSINVLLIKKMILRNKIPDYDQGGHFLRLPIQHNMYELQDEFKLMVSDIAKDKIDNSYLYPLRLAQIRAENGKFTLEPLIQFLEDDRLMVFSEFYLNELIRQTESRIFSYASGSNMIIKLTYLSEKDRESIEKRKKEILRVIHKKMRSKIHVQSEIGTSQGVYIKLCY